MRNPRLVIAGVVLAAAAAIGGISAAVATGSPASGGSYGSSAPGTTAPARGASPVHTATAAVGGRTEQILVNSRGLPLYYYQPDTATMSMVDPGVAQLWPPLTSATAPTSGELPGKLTAVHDRYGSQVAYQGHLLYTFTNDRAGQVTGQGIQNFFIATPDLTPLTGTATPDSSAPAAPYGGSGY
jgi:predicted lipoprotein with Yx(FWY)xxD motif